MADQAPLAAAFLSCTAGLIAAPEVQAMKLWRHHRSITCYQHSLFVSYVAFRLARRFGWDQRAAARAGLLHDLYLYDPSSLPSREQCRRHPVAALENARRLCPDLTEPEANAIRSHMWPLASCRPRSSVAAAVILADKLCSMVEAACLFREARLRRWLPEPAPV